MSTEMMNGPQDKQNGERDASSAIQRYHLGWVLLSMVVTAVLVVLYFGGVDTSTEGWTAVIMLPLIVGAMVFRSMLIADYKKQNNYKGN